MSLDRLLTMFLHHRRKPTFFHLNYIDNKGSKQMRLVFEENYVEKLTGILGSTNMTNEQRKCDRAELTDMQPISNTTHC